MQAPAEVRRLLEERGAVLLAHNYQRPEVQDAAHFVGDSLELSLKAVELDARVLVFAGVDFMAEQAAILNPGKVVLHPEPLSRCPMAAMLAPEVVRKYKEMHPGAPFVAYVNSSAEVKALADYVVTSANAVALVSQLDADTVLFGPDRHLAEYVAEKTGKTVIPVPGFGHCPVHLAITRSDLERAKREHPDAKVLVHPECTRDVRALADFIGSTSQMLQAARELGASRYVVATEVGLVHRLSRLGFEAYPASPYAVCPDMKKITLESVVQAVLKGRGVVRVDPRVAERARRAIENTFELLGVSVPWRRS
uniref:Quinolinate synthase n=1 Tax=Thermofilum pendens TaxID=2269 RepID=A0A7C3WW10_THEPE